jgi:hypothetical protein
VAGKLAPPSPNPGDALARTYAINDAMNSSCSRASTGEPGEWSCPGRREAAAASPRFSLTYTTIGVWLKNSAPHLKCPPPLDPARCTIKQASTAHRKSAEQCLRMLAEALSGDPNRRVATFSRGSWAPTWPADATMFAYMFCH